MVVGFKEWLGVDATAMKEGVPYSRSVNGIVRHELQIEILGWSSTSHVNLFMYASDHATRTKLMLYQPRIMPIRFENLKLRWIIWQIYNPLYRKLNLIHSIFYAWLRGFSINYLFCECVYFFKERIMQKLIRYHKLLIDISKSNHPPNCTATFCVSMRRVGLMHTSTGLCAYCFTLGFINCEIIIILSVLIHG